jgi:hypothetical protein
MRVDEHLEYAMDGRKYPLSRAAWLIAGAGGTVAAVARVRQPPRSRPSVSNEFLGIARLSDETFAAVALICDQDTANQVREQCALAYADRNPVEPVSA